MKLRSRYVVWFLAMASFLWLGCGGGDDDLFGPGPHVDGAADAPSRDAGHDGASDTGSNPPDGGASDADGGVTPGADADLDAVVTVDGVVSDAPVADVPSVDEPPPDASGTDDAPPGMDVGTDVSATDAATMDVVVVDVPVVDVSVVDTSKVDAGPDVSVVDAGTADVVDASVVVDVASEPVEDHAVPPVDAGHDVQTPDVSVDTGSTVDSGTTEDAQGTDGGVPVDAPEEIAVEASFDGADDGGTDGATLDALGDGNGDAGDGSDDSNHWNIAASPPECSPNPNQVSCSDTGVAFEVYSQTQCPTALADADLWFPAGAPPDPGPHVVHPAADPSDLLAVTGNEVALVFSRMSQNETWWAQSGTVEVEVIGNKRFVRFSDIQAFLDTDHTKTTTIGGQLICIDGPKPKP